MNHRTNVKRMGRNSYRFELGRQSRKLAAAVSQLTNGWRLVGLGGTSPSIDRTAPTLRELRARWHAWALATYNGDEPPQADEPAACDAIDEPAGVWADDDDEPAREPERPAMLHDADVMALARLVDRYGHDAVASIVDAMRTTPAATLAARALDARLARERRSA